MIAKNKGWVLSLLALSQLIISLDYLIVIVALPDIARDLGFSPQNLQWVASAYAVAYGGFLLLGGRAADLLGRRRMFIFAMGMFGIASLVGGVAPNPAVLVAARAVQGLNSALLFPATLSLVNTLFEEGPARNRALSVWSGAGASGLALGSLFGGLLTGWWGWSAVFFVNVPLAVIAIIGAVTLIPADPARERGRRFDLPGALLATAGVTSLAFALIQGPETGWGSPLILGAFVVAVLLLASFIAVERRTRDPLMPLRLFANRSMRSADLFILIFGASFVSQPYFFTLYFQNVQGYSAIATGLAFLLPSVLIMLGTQFSGRLAGRLGIRTVLLTGTLVGAVGTLLAAFGIYVGASYTTPLFLIGLIALSLGQGFAWTGMWIASAAGVAPREQGIAGGLASSANQIGSALGLGVLVAVGNLAGQPGVTQIADGVRHAMFFSALLVLIGSGISLTFTKKSMRAGEQSQEREPVIAG